MHHYTPAERRSVSSSAASYIDDSAQSTAPEEDDSSLPRASDASCPPAFRTSTPASWYAALASEPPRAEDFIVYDAPDDSLGRLDSQHSVSQCSDGPVVISEKLPDEDQLSVAGELSIHDSETTTVPFRSLYSGSQHAGSRQLIVFIRHFYCNACRDYVKALARTLPESRAPGVQHTSVAIISGCSPKLLGKYSAMAGTNFRMYADPRRRLFQALGCKRYTVNFGRRRPRYAHTNLVSHVLGSFYDVARAKGKERFQGGSMLQIGGEFLFEDEQPVWCHRMTNMRDHTEVDDLTHVLTADDADRWPAFSSYDASFIDDDVQDVDDNDYENSGACTSSSGPCGTPWEPPEAGTTPTQLADAANHWTQSANEASVAGGTPTKDADADTTSLFRPPTLRRVTEELSEDDAARFRERPSCVPGHRGDDPDPDAASLGSRFPM